jgi:hypothetical protein|tara:strand:+ start:125 stop:634 length:510 start_codon:yes stop_codon:yes gene_type:complete
MNGFLRTLVKPDWDDNPKRSEILNAANLIQIGEFQLIQLAYKAWYEKDLPEDKISNIFNEYMVTGIIPIWVTYYAADIIKLDKANVLDSYNKKYHIYDYEFGKQISDEKQRKNRGIFYTILIGLVFVASHYMAIISVDESAGFYPPYIEKKVIYPELYQKDSVSEKYKK